MHDTTTRHEQGHQTEQRAAEIEHDPAEQATFAGLSRGLLEQNAPARSLPGDLRAGMERSFGADFSGVRVHEDGAADALGADAYAAGKDLHFARGQYDPGSHSGRELIGHELAHVVQQDHGAPAGQGRGVELEGSPALEREADEAGARAARGEPARVLGASSGLQLKGPFSKVKSFFKDGDRTFLDAARDQEAPVVAAERVVALQERLEAKAELRFKTSEDGGLVERLEQAASNEVEQIAEHDSTATDTQKDDVKAGSDAIARRSKAVKRAVSHRAKEIAEELAKDAAYKQAFEDKAIAAFDKVTVSKAPNKKALIAQAKREARAAARRIDEAQYQLAKVKLDEMLLNDKTTIEQSLTTDTRTNVTQRAEDAMQKRGDVDTKVTTIAGETKKPWVDRIEDQVEKYLVSGLGAKGAAWYRSQELKDFRKDMKSAGRKQAITDIDTELSTQTGMGGATKRYVGMDSRTRAYDKAKQSVNSQLEDVAKQGTTEVMTAEQVDELVTAAARQAAFLVYEKDGHMPAARAAATQAAKAKSEALAAGVMTAAKTWKDQIVKGGATPERQDVQDGVVSKVETDEVGKRSVESSIKANTPDEGMSKLGHFFDVMVPERGDALKFKVKLEVPAGPGNVLIAFEGEAERGTRERLLKRQHGGPTKVERDTASLKIQTELKIGYSGALPGVKLEGALGFFLRSDAASTDMCMKAMSYGIYRFLSGAIPPLANLWGGDARKTKAMSEGDPDLDDDVYRSELWAAMIEEQVFKEDKQARVDLGMSLSGGAEVNAGLVKGKGGLRGELMRSYDYDALRMGKRTGPRQRGFLGLPGKHTGPRTHNKVGDDSFDKQGAHDRRKAMHGRTALAFMLEAEVEAAIANNSFVFGGKLKYMPPAEFELEISGGLKLTSADPSDTKTRMIAGICGAGTNIVKSLVGSLRGAVDDDHTEAGGAGNIADLLTRTAGDMDNIAGNQVGQALTQAYQVQTSQSDGVNDTIANTLGTNTNDADPTTKAGAASETTYKISIVIGYPFKLIVKIDEVQTKKLDIGLGGPGLNIEYEKSRRVGQIGVSQGRFHGELMGVSTKT